MRSRIPGILLLALSSLHAQPKPGVVEGTVINSTTRAPVPQASVSLASREGFSRVGRTDDSGNFQIPNVEPGVYRIEYVRAPNFLYDAPRTAAINVAEDQRVNGIVLELLPLGVIGGRVVDNDGAPLMGAQVAIMYIRYTDDGSKTLGTSDGAVTDDRGEYRVFHLKPGRYFVNVWLPPGQIHDGLFRSDWLPPNTRRTTPELGYMPVFYPNGADLSQASPVLLAPGAEMSGINFQLRAVPVFHVRGTVSGYQSKGPATSVMATPCPAPEGAAEYSGKVQPGGAFDLTGVGAGTYCLTLAQGGDSRTLYAADTVTVADLNAEGVALRGMPAFTVAGAIRIEGPAIDLDDSVVTATPASKSEGTFNNALVNGGKFQLEGSVPGNYRIRSNPNRLPDPAYLKSVIYGERDVPNGLIALQPGASGLTLVFGSDAGRLKGTVQEENGDPAGGIEVCLVPASESLAKLGEIRWSMTDANGNFQVAGLAPGDYRVFAWGDSDVPMAWVAEFRDAFAARAGTATVAAGTASTVQVKVIPADEIRKVKARY
jgi:hypothetical protein